MDETLTQDRSRWQLLFDEISLGRHGQAVTIEVLDEELGDQTEATALPFGSLGYDERGDVVVVALEGRGGGRGSGPGGEAPVVLRHLVHAPRQLDVLEQGDAMVLRLVDGGGAQTLLVFRPDQGDGSAD